MQKPSDRLSTSFAAMFLFIVAVTAVEAVALGLAELVFDPTGAQRLAIGLPVFIAAAVAGTLVLRRIENRPETR